MGGNQIGCVFIHVVTTVITCFCWVFSLFFFFLTAANEAGETPLDIARRLKHAQCEELVSAPGFNFATCICELKRLNNNLFLCVLFTVESSAGGEIQRPRPCGV